MAVSADRKYTKSQVYKMLEWAKGKTLGEIDSQRSRQFDRTKENPKITGIAGDVIEQSVFQYERDSKQECDIEIDGVLTELKTTGVRVPKSDLKKALSKTGEKYNVFLSAKEGISITGVTFEPEIQIDFPTSHFWEKSEHLLIVFYEYKSYETVSAAEYKDFPIVDYCYNTFSEDEKARLRSDWEIVRDFLLDVYAQYSNKGFWMDHLEGFTHTLRSKLLLIDLAPGFHKRSSGSYQKPRYRLKRTFVDTIVRGHFNKNRSKHEISLKQSFSSFAELDQKCHMLREKYAGWTLADFKSHFDIKTDIGAKHFTAKCVLAMFEAKCGQLNQIRDFTEAGIIAKTITMTIKHKRTEDMKLSLIDFQEWNDRDNDFEESSVYEYFTEHSFLCPIFIEHDAEDPSKTTFEGFKRFTFDNDFINHEVFRIWNDSRNLVFHNELKYDYEYDKFGNIRVNPCGSLKGAPNFPKSSEYTIFLRAGANDSRDENKTVVVNNIRMLPQYFWIKGSYIVDKLNSLPFI